MAARKGAGADADRGKYREVRDEKELLRVSYKEPRVVIHFAHKEFRRCAILDRHLEVRRALTQHLARQHPHTLFLKADVQDTPFLVEKLKIKVLPCMLAFVDGVCKERFVGFEDFGNADNFSTAALEWRLGRVGTCAGLTQVSLRRSRRRASRSSASACRTRVRTTTRTGTTR